MALHLKGLGKSHQEISGFVGLSLNTLTRLFTAYAKKGLSAVRVLNYTHKRTPLEDHRELLQKHFAENPPASVKQARDDIERLTGIKKGLTRIRIFLHQLGMDPRKVGGIPSKADPERQEEFKKKSMELVLGKAKDGKAVVYFVDAAHFVLGAFLAILWSFRRIFVETSSGRHRLNVLGALNAVTKEMITVINTTYINSWSVVELMRKIREAHPEGKIVLVLDNARYQACYLVKSGANMLNIDLLFLPPYFSQLESDRKSLEVY